MRTEDAGLKSPMVSICCTTYNQEKFIADAIEGFLMQKTDFPVEILIHDDASTDGTADVVRRYEAEHPSVIRAVYQTVNQFSQGKKPRPMLLGMAKGKYIALCDGDDYWTDPHKLQKQVDFLESNPEFVMCGHDIELTFEGGVEPRAEYPRDFPRAATFDDIWRKSHMPIASLTFRNHVIREIPQWYHAVLSGDTALTLMLAHHGKCYYMTEKMARARRHPGGITQTEMYDDKLFRLKDRLTIYRGVMNYSGRRGALLNNAVGYLHWRISSEYALRHDPVRSAAYLLTALFTSGFVRYEVLVKPVAARTPTPVRRMLRRILPQRLRPLDESGGTK